MTLVQSNCVLKAVAAPGSTENWDDSGTAGGSLWSGTERAYYQEKRDRTPGTQISRAEDLLVLRSLIVQEQVPPVTYETEQHVTFRLDGDGADSTGIIKNIERRVFAPAGNLQTTRLVLEVL